MCLLFFASLFSCVWSSPCLRLSLSCCYSLALPSLNILTLSHFLTHLSQGYVGCAVLLTEHEDLLRLIIQTIKNDLAGTNNIAQCLALACISHVGGREFAESLGTDVFKLLTGGRSVSIQYVFNLRQIPLSL